MPLDWSKIKCPTPQNDRPRCAAYHPHDYWRLVAMSKIRPKSLAQLLTAAVLNVLERDWASYEEKIIMDAQREGISPEEKFMQLVDDQ